MASAGRILIMPKGLWNEEEEYEMLDVVKYLGWIYLAKKPSKGIIPGGMSNEYWMDMFNMEEVVEQVEKDMLLRNNVFVPYVHKGQATLTEDLFGTYETATFVQWNKDTLNTPFKEGLTDCENGFAIVHGTYGTDHTIIAWAQGGTQINIFMHKFNDGEDIGWDTFLKSSGGTLTGDLKINKKNPRLQMKNESNSRHAIIESGADGYTSIGNWAADDDQINLQIRKPSGGVDDLVSITVNGDRSYRLFGEHNIDHLKELLGLTTE